MPIKFRCQHCRQFLGISRAKASEVVDCPTCGRTIRVPDLEGRVRPLPKPRIDTGDSQLAKALDALAAIGDRSTRDVDQFDSADSSDTAQTDSSADGPGHQAMAMAPEPVELAPLPEPEPVQLEPVVSTPAPPPAEEGSWAKTAQPDEAWKELMAKADDEALPQAVQPNSATNSPPLSVATSSKQSTNPTTVFAMVGISAVIFSAGFWVGRITTVAGNNGVSNVDTSKHPSGDSVSDGDGQPNNAVDVDRLTAAFRGRITYRTEAGETRADKGARVIVIPADRTGTSKLPAAGFQLDAANQDRRIALASIREMGGDFCIADEEGKFNIKLKSSGQYQILVLSNSLSRDATDEDENAQQTVAQYFDRSNQLLGRVKYHLEKVRYSGDGTEPWDYSFQRT